MADFVTPFAKLELTSDETTNLSLRIMDQALYIKSIAGTLPTKTLDPAFYTYYLGIPYTTDARWNHNLRLLDYTYGTGLVSSRKVQWCPNEVMNRNLGRILTQYIALGIPLQAEPREG